ncbi:TetR/AcrR family transcriptional regulator [Chryseobacterium wangxinyae]|uniref:TetR/AcrR family transcriptional regulator n=1 Tax=unclassified Chryseobacterium TaxID=2593645 RepID=UPI00226DB7D0|nr:MULTISPECIES: TetR/AcrR family transcriptional regulator [unclassified Chryseobacterium]MCY0969333.1 TetR/AcrR family transcriptional regulator [Chryseobacterium sp. CY353]MCY0979320.1 TetR/AcrR family transcriptional regulator [Chryseobacterium sp. CY350]WBZ95952.1 TetR/AcrR family transcriptional regulator [Chryseobacterium sp. CY350]
MDKKEERLNKILETTIDLLIKEGAENLSMRKVAKNAGLSLSNLQYYYKDKNLLLIATVEFYFESCKNELSQAIKLLSSDSAPDKNVFLEKILNMLLVDGRTSHQTLMFQEIWTLAARNKELQVAVETYYKTYCLWLIDLVSKFCKNPDEIVSFLIPFVEGYTIVSNVIPLKKDGVIEMMVKLISIVEK